MHDDELVSSLSRELLETISSGVAIYEVEGDGHSGVDYRIIYFNDYALKHEGLTLKEVQGKSLKDLRPKIDEYGLIDVFRSVWKTGEPGHFPAKVYSDDRYANWYENRIFRLNENMIVAIYDDVTQMKVTEEKLRSYIDSAPYGFFIAGSTGRYVDVNREAEEITGYSRDELLKMSIAEIVAPDALQAGMEHFQRVVESGISEGYIPFIRKDGERRIWNVRAVALSDGNFMAFTRDVTETIRLQRRMQEYHDRFTRAESIGGVGVWEYDIENGVFWASPGARILAGLDTREETVTFDDLVRMVPDVKRLRNTLYELIEGGSAPEVQFQVHMPDTSEKRTISTLAQVTENSEGVPIKVVGVMRDITARVRSERMIRESENKYYSLFRNMRDALSITDEGRRIIDFNESFLEMFQYSRKEMVGSNVRPLYASEEDFLRMGDLLDEMLREQEPRLRTEKVRFRRRSGEEFTGELSLYPRFDSNDQFTGFISVIRDISHREMLEAELRQTQKMEAIGQLAGGIAHDFNNLLTIINGYSYMLLESKDTTDEDYGELMEIKRAGHRAAELTGQLLAFSRKQMLEPRTLNINDRLLETESILRRLIGENITIQTILSRKPLYVRVDPAQLDQILINLAVNARDAMPDGGTLTLETRIEDITSEEAAEMGLECWGQLGSISVADTGIGIEEEVMDHIFEPFYTTKGIGSGTGMGLSTVYGIVKQSEGDIKVDSFSGIGTTFTVYLPMKPVQDSDSADQDHTFEESSGGERILLVEDEDSVRELICSSLRAAGFEVSAASDGLEAMTVLKEQEQAPDLLLTDVMMPGLSGRKLAEKILRIHPAIPVLFMSGYTDRTVENLGISIENTYFIQKPFLPSKLVGRIREIIDPKDFSV